MFGRRDLSRSTATDAEIALRTMGSAAAAAVQHVDLRHPTAFHATTMKCIIALK